MFRDRLISEKCHCSLSPDSLSYFVDFEHSYLPIRFILRIHPKTFPAVLSALTHLFENDLKALTKNVSNHVLADTSVRRNLRRDQHSSSMSSLYQTCLTATLLLFTSDWPFISETTIISHPAILFLFRLPLKSTAAISPQISVHRQCQHPIDRHLFSLDTSQHRFAPCTTHSTDSLHSAFKPKLAPESLCVIVNKSPKLLQHKFQPNLKGAFHIKFWHFFQRSHTLPADQ